MYKWLYLSECAVIYCQCLFFNWETNQEWTLLWVVQKNCIASPFSKELQRQDRYQKWRQAPKTVSAVDPFVYTLASNIYQWKEHEVGLSMWDMILILQSIHQDNPSSFESSLGNQKQLLPIIRLHTLPWISFVYLALSQLCEVFFMEVHRQNACFLLIQ